MKFWDIASTNKDGVLDMYVYGDIKTDRGWFGGADDVITREFISDLQKHPNVKRINVHINSGGGEVFAAVAMAQQLKKHPAEVHTYVEGVAASAATIIAMAGDVRHMTVSSLYMIHLPSTNVQGNKHQIAKGIEVLEKVEDIIRLTYQNKTKLSDEQLTDMLDHETWLTAPEAKKYGFISEIEEDPDEEEKEEEEGDEGEKKLKSLIKDVTAEIVSINGIEFNIAAYADPLQLRAKLDTIKNTKGGMSMDFQAFLNTLSEENRSALLATIENQITEKTGSLTEQVTNLTSQLASATDQLTQAQNATREAIARAEAAEEQLKKLQDTEDEDTKFLNSLPADAKKAVLEARRVAAEAQKQVSALQDEKDFAAFKDSLGEFGNLPIEDKHVQALYNIQKAAPQDYATIESLLTPANEAMEALMHSIGTDAGQAAPTDAYEHLNKLAEDKMKDNSELSYNDAFQMAVQENPALYEQYRETL